MFFVVILSLGISGGVIPPFDHATLSDPCLFTSHISYTPMLAWAAYLLFSAVLFDSKLPRRAKPWLSAAGLLVVIDLFLTKGVAGYAAIIMLLGLLVLQWRKNILWPALTVLLLAGSAYWVSPAVHRRVDQNIREVVNVFEGTASKENRECGRVENTSIGPRMVFWENTWQIIKQNPVLGVGTGDFPAEYEQVRQKRTPNHWKDVNNPHNMYLMILAQSGIVGLAVVLTFFGCLLRRALPSPGVNAKITVGLVCFFLLIMMSDAYLTLSHTSLLLALFTAGVAKSSNQIG